MELSLVDPSQYSGIFSTPSVPELKFVDVATPCTSSASSYCIDAGLPIKYNLLQNGASLIGRQNTVRLQVVRAVDNFLVYSSQHAALSQNLFGQWDGFFDKTRGVWFSVDNNGARRVLLAARNGEYAVTLRSRSLSPNKNSSTAAYFYDDISDPDVSKNANAVYCNTNDGIVVWHVSAGDTAVFLQFDVRENSNDTLTMSMLWHIDSNTIVSYMDARARAENSNEGIFFTGNDFTPVWMFSGIDIGALNSSFHWDGLVHVGNNFTYVPEQGEYRIVVEAFGFDEKSYCSTEKKVYVNLRI
jgi:hypothetical protein